MPGFVIRRPPFRTYCVMICADVLRSVKVVEEIGISSALKL
jgi:hypothetical protein